MLYAFELIEGVRGLSKTVFEDERVVLIVGGVGQVVTVLVGLVEEGA